MKEILFNLALINTLNYGKTHGVDTSDTHLVKYPRQYKYSLVKNDTGNAIITVTFHKSQVPSYSIVSYK